MKKNQQIDILRGILAIFIILYHYTYRFTELYGIKTIEIPLLDKLGLIGVGGFFIITGFFIIPSNCENFNFFYFLKKKILRIYPSYLLCLTIIFISVSIFGLPGRETTILDYFLNITMINGVIHTDYVDGAHWYLTYLIIFYVILGIFLASKKNFDFLIFIWLSIKIILKCILFRIPDISAIYRLVGR